MGWNGMNCFGKCVEMAWDELGWVGSLPNWIDNWFWMGWDELGWDGLGWEGMNWVGKWIGKWVGMG